MAYELRELSGSLHKNDRKNTKDHPDYTGSVMVDGVEYWLSAWIKDGKKGKWMSLGLKPKDGQQARRVEQRAPVPGGKGTNYNAPEPKREQRSYAEELDDQIPF